MSRHALFHTFISHVRLGPCDDSPLNPGPLIVRTTGKSLHTTTVATMSESLVVKNDGLGEQLVWQACCCTIASFDVSDCSPTLDTTCLAKLCGQTGKSLACCVEQDVAYCLCPAHSLYDQILTGPTAKENVCCICCHQQATLVKPFCLSGEKPLCKSYSDGCCCQSRQACPCDADVPGMVAMYGIKCCDCGPFKCDVKPCHKIPPLSEAMQATSVETSDATIGDEYLLFAYGCCICSMYIPDTYQDAFGFTDNSLCCLCCENELKGCMLPKELSREESASTCSHLDPSATPCLLVRCHPSLFTRAPPAKPPPPAAGCMRMPRAASSLLQPACAAAHPSACASALCHTVMLLTSGQARVIKPPIMQGGPCCKGVTRTFCAVTKFAFPCDNEVPIVFAVFGCKLCERTINGECKFGDDKKVDPATGKKPLFSKVQTITPKSVKVTANETMDRA